MVKILRPVCLIVVLMVVLSLGMVFAPQAVGAPAGVNVLIVAADDASYLTAWQASLSAFPDIGAVDTYDARYGTPTLEDLSDYNAVLVWSNYSFLSATALGDVLADYVDSGGGVVLATFVWYGATSWDLEGRLVDDGYSPFVWAGSSLYSTANLGWYDSTNPVMAGVTSISGYYRDYVSLATGATLIAQWDDGNLFVAEKGSVVGVTLYPGYSWSGDVTRLFHNALVRVAGEIPPPRANFSADVQAGDAPLTVKFRDLSTGDITGGSFRFGDGQSYGDQWVTLIHTYENEGIYNACLTVSGPGGTSTKCIDIIVESMSEAPRLSVTNLVVTPVYAQPRQEIAISADVVNTGGAWGTLTVNLVINGQFEQSAQAGVSPGTKQPVRFTVYKVDPGTYQVDVGGVVGTLYIMETSTPAPAATQTPGLLAGGELGDTGMIAIIVIGVIVLAGIVIAIVVARR